MPSTRRPFNESAQLIYEACFSMNVSDQNETWVPHIIFDACRTMLNRWQNDKQKETVLKFTKPIIWRKPLCREDCYICTTKLAGMNTKNKNQMQMQMHQMYADVPTITIPIESNVAEIRNKNGGSSSMTVAANTVASNKTSKRALTSIHDSLDDEDDNDDDDDDYDDGHNENETDETYVPSGEKSRAPRLISQAESNNLVRKLCNNKDFRKYFDQVKVTNAEDQTEESKLVYCKDINGLMEELKPGKYRDNEWRLFIDSSTRSPKAVLLHNTNTLAPVSVTHSTTLKEEYNTLGFVLEKLNYSTHKRDLCGDSKILGMALRQQSGFTKKPCHLCLWDSRERDKYYTQVK